MESETGLRGQFQVFGLLVVVIDLPELLEHMVTILGKILVDVDELPPSVGQAIGG